MGKARASRYQAVVLVEYCAAIAGIAQSDKVEITNVALKKDWLTQVGTRGLDVRLGRRGGGDEG